MSYFDGLGIAGLALRMYFYNLYDKEILGHPMPPCWVVHRYVDRGRTLPRVRARIYLLVPAFLLLLLVLLLIHAHSLF
jgi:hypothetical protein